jgi:WD40 repeat protein
MTMNRLLLSLSVGLLFTTRTTAQDCRDYPRLMREGAERQASKHYREALNKYNAAKLCDPAKAPEVDERINALFAAIEGEKQEAERQRDAATAANSRAVRATALATRQATEAKVLYWASESDKLTPVQALRLLQQAARLRPGTRPVEERIARRFNESDYRPFVQLDLRHSSSVRSGLFSPDGNLILTVCTQKTAHLWDLKGIRLAQFTHASEIRAVAFAPDGSQLLTAADDSAKLWNLSGTLLASLPYPASVRSVQFSPDGTRILTVGNTKFRAVISHTENTSARYTQKVAEDRTVRLWNLKGDLLATITPDATPNSARFSPDGTHILTVSAGKITLWNLAGQLLAEIPHLSRFGPPLFLPDGTQLLTQMHDSTQLWDVRHTPFVTRTQSVEGRLAGLSPDGKQILTLIKGDKAMCWDVNGALRATFTHVGIVVSVTSSQYSGPDGSDNENFNATQSLKDFNNIDLLAFSPDGSQVLTSVDGTAKLWSRDATLLATLPYNDPLNHVEFEETDEEFGLDVATARAANSVLFSPNGHYLLTKSDDKDERNVRLWNREGIQLAVLEHPTTVISALFSPTGNRVLTITHDNTAHLWNLEAGMLIPFNFNEIRTTYTLSDGTVRKTVTRGNTRNQLTAAEALKWLKENNDKVAPLSEENRLKYGVPTSPTRAAAP